jgi:hypothetical protein
MASKRWSGINTYSVHEAQNAALGQGGSALITGTSEVAVPEGKTIIAITFLEDTVFDNSSGLVAEDETRWANSEALASKTATSNDDVVDGETFPAGITIYDRWTKVNLTSGLVMIYVA